mmetsp:Transcript_30404/g.61229  ORF Transcript_30404/g.61229 Transcript_30404/m.61229 type:complete len:337 (-) Transcript_30404:753-1763(-)
MAQSVADGDALGGVHDENVVEKVGKLLDLLAVVAGGLCLHELLVDAHDGLVAAHLVDHLLLGDHVLGQVLEEHVALLLLKVLVEELRLAQHLLRRHPLEIQELLEHVVVAAAGEHELARVELVEAHADRPQVHGVAVLEPDTDLGRAVVARDHVGRDGALSDPVRGAEVADGDALKVFGDQDVVQLDVTVDNLAFDHVEEADEHLAGVGLDCLERDADLAAVCLEQLAEVHLVGDKHHAEVVLVLKVREQLADVLAALGVLLPEPLQHLNLLAPRVVHGLVGPHHLDRNLPRLLHVFRADHRAVHPVADVAVHPVAVDDELAGAGAEVALSVIPVV